LTFARVFAELSATLAVTRLRCIPGSGRFSRERRRSDRQARRFVASSGIINRALGRDGAIERGGVR
jgi:hypothetical protein